MFSGICLKFRFFVTKNSVLLLNYIANWLNITFFRFLKIFNLHPLMHLNMYLTPFHTSYPHDNTPLKCIWPELLYEQVEWVLDGWLGEDDGLEHVLVVQVPRHLEPRQVALLLLNTRIHGLLYICRMVSSLWYMGTNLRQNCWPG